MAEKRAMVIPPSPGRDAPHGYALMTLRRTLSNRVLSESFSTYAQTRENRVALVFQLAERPWMHIVSE
jgi:hypothetical protein